MTVIFTRYQRTAYAERTAELYIAENDGWEKET